MSDELKLSIILGNENINVIRSSTKTVQNSSKATDLIILLNM